LLKDNFLKEELTEKYSEFMHRNSQLLRTK
jgi:hypothetical protein